MNKYNLDFLKDDIDTGLLKFKRVDIDTGLLKNKRVGMIRRTLKFRKNNIMGYDSFAEFRYLPQFKSFVVLRFGGFA